MEEKEYITNVNLHREPKTGDLQRFKTQWEETYQTPQLPTPIDIEDIDKAVFDFFEDGIKLYDKNNALVPTFSWFSNQVFSEYSQTWEHVDEEGNLLMDFKGITREANPTMGTITGLGNIPGNRKYTVAKKVVLEDNGEESYEYYTMQQPTPVDLKYTISFVTNRFSMTNIFFNQILYLFKARQCYIRVNEHYVRLLLNGTNDDTSYEIQNIKYYRVSASITAYAYLIPKDTLTVQKFPKTKRLSIDKDKPIGKPLVNFFEYNEENRIDISVDFRGNITKTDFDTDKDIHIDTTTFSNLRTLKVYINENIVTNITEGFTIKHGDSVTVKVVKLEKEKDINILFRGTLL